MFGPLTIGPCAGKTLLRRAHWGRHALGALPSITFGSLAGCPDEGAEGDRHAVVDRNRPDVGDTVTDRRRSGDRLQRGHHRIEDGSIDRLHRVGEGEPTDGQHRDDSRGDAERQRQ